MWRKSLSGFLSRTIPLAALLMASTAQADVLWSNPWTYTTPMLLETYPSPSLVFTEDGGVIVGSISSSGGDRATTRINADGSLYWTSNLYGYRGFFEQSIGTALDLEDGGAIVTLGSSWPYVSGEISRLDATGDILWSRAAQIGSVSRLDASRLVYTNCNVLTAADVQSGKVLWQRAYDRSRYCVGSSNSIADSGDVYASFSMPTGNQVTGYRIIKADSAGVIQWNVTAQVNGGGLIVASGATALYLKTNSSLVALSKLDGSTLWSAPVWEGSRILVSEDAATDPIVVEFNSVRRLSATSGNELWSVSTTPCTSCAMPKVIDNFIVGLVNSGLALAKIDAATGSVAWTSALPTQDADGRSLEWRGFGNVASNRMLGVATARTNLARTAHFQSIEFSSGMLQSAPLPPVTEQGLLGSSVSDGNDVFDAAYGMNQVEQKLRLRHFNATTGALIWETSTPTMPESFAPYYDLNDQYPYAAVGNDAVAVATTSKAYNQTGTFGLAQVDVFDRATGNLRWSTLLWQDYQRLTYASTPQFDSAGNVLVGIGTSLPCGFDNVCAHKFIYKLSAQTGEVLWEFDNTDSPGSITEGSPQVFPQDFEVFGNDVVVAGYFSGTAHTLLRISGVDGSPVWSSDQFAGGGGVSFYRQDDQHIIIHGMGLKSRMDVADGSVLWTSASVPIECSQNCFGYDQIVLADGDLIAVGEGEFRPWVTRMHNDGSGLSDNWWLDSYNPKFRSFITLVRQTPSGKIMLHGGKRYRGSLGKLALLLEVDPATGMLLSQQVLSNGEQDATTEGLSPIMTGFPVDNLMLFNGYRISETLPYATGAGLLDTTIVEHGNLQLDISLDSQQAPPGRSIGFQLHATYSGDLPIEGAQLFAGLYLPGGMSNLDCQVQAAGNCAIDIRSGNVNASFDIQPGGSVNITGQLIAIEQDEAYYFSGTVSGPVSLSESDTVDNFSRAMLINGIFRDGFEQSPIQ